MGFKEDLEQLCGKVEGSFAASVMGFDGIPIETHEARPADGIELATLLVEYSGIINQVRQAAETLQMGKASEVAIRTEKLVAAARRCTSRTAAGRRRWATSACAWACPSRSGSWAARSLRPILRRAATVLGAPARPDSFSARCSAA